MIYYLQDLASNNILLITADVFLINNIKSGILDSHRFTISSEYKPTIDKITDHTNSASSDGIKFTPGGLETFSLENFPGALEKQELVRIRVPAFKLLLRCAAEARSNNRYGFSVGDEVYIQHALNNSDAITAYAQIMNISSFFAKEELSMITDSIFLDNFRIFTVCNMWKERINKCTTVEEIDSILGPIKDTFWMAGIPNVT